MLLLVVIKGPKCHCGSLRKFAKKSAVLALISGVDGKLSLSFDSIWAALMSLSISVVESGLKLLKVDIGTCSYRILVLLLLLGISLRVWRSEYVEPLMILSPFGSFVFCRLSYSTSLALRDLKSMCIRRLPAVPLK